MLKPLEVLRLYPDHDYTLAGAFDSRAQRDPKRPFIVFNGRTWSWAEFGAAVANTARLLVARGVKKGDRIGVLACNDIGHALLLFACARIGAIMVPSNPEYGVQEAGYVLKHAGVSAVACNEDAGPVVLQA
jgi:carnitine-CoA ligase